MYKIKETFKRGAAFVAAGALLGTTVTTALPAITFADPLNPLTERSLMLSSSSPGYHYLDGSGNSTFAGPGTGNNGQKTGETYSFRVSTDSSASGPDIKAFTFQYCTTPAGQCKAPGNIVDDSPDPTTQSNLNINYTAPVEGTDFDVYVGNGSTTPSTGWSMATSRVVDINADNTTPIGDPAEPDDKNFITLTNATGVKPTATTQIRVVFKASETNYITNPGTGAFFVKVNDYTSTDSDDHLPATDDFVIDGGVTVANVMNDSIWIQTKVLETMDFSVGTENPDTVVGGPHGTCDPITENLPLKMGNVNAENSLSTTEAYDTTSYWRLSTNASGGATVYYSGNTLSNTVGDKIPGIGLAAVPSLVGAEQFGLAIDTTADTIDTANPPSTGPFSANTIAPLVAEGPYSDGAGSITNNGTASFAFDEDSLNTPAKIAAETSEVLRCATGKMRYIANIAAYTPAGVYTSKINYIAAPQY